MEMLTELLNNVPQGTIWAVVVGLVVSLVLQLLKKWLDLQSDKVINTLLGALSFTAVAINYLTQAVSQNPAILGQRTFVIMGVATTLYNFIVKPTNIVLKDARSYRERKARVALEAAAPVQSVTTGPEQVTLTPAAVEAAPAEPDFQA